MPEPKEHWMRLAIDAAKNAGQSNEVPIGAVLVSESGDLLAVEYNRTIQRMDPTAHAEILALREAALRIRNYRLPGTSLFVTIEPCIMCMGALVHARVARIFFGAHDPKWGAAGSLYDVAGDNRFNHRPEIFPGLLEAECRELMQTFFRSKR
jgi:tRNA(adenine34) deaminase